MIDKVSSLGVYPSTLSDSQAIYSKKDILGKDDFLKILITELTHQDPLDPLKDRDMIAQMAQLSQLEQITQFTHSVDKMFDTFKNALESYQAMQAASIVGKMVKVKDVPIMQVTDNGTLSVSFEIEKEAYVNAKVYDWDGNLVSQESLGVVGKGTHIFNPSDRLDPGSYVVSFEAVDGEGNPVNISVYGWDQVVESQKSEDGIYLILENGEKKPLDSVVAYR
ncbi:flagellar basal-body rod modification protein FlgD [Thermosulfidibacter takaii ABI70S6]|uniref:Basal-body rod modification protein FlgD n=1 Tax=Thermosulfidibacter takaii (strain DSM 17441 / JCM 13301 / NBRC 103674 / ABI70S6) TaxID=1298851 RepID=A0A0S3QSX6_THET7|nr:flagellar hook assembly protein FlgD [Thermosulfidibacter takaii]BAT71442.1 flagellar basal-body rod modification protein FlgD [Thermosulfidibacter takaii ABI70S6]